MVDYTKQAHNWNWEWCWISILRLMDIWLVYWALGLNLTTWADCGLIWIPNKRRPWDSPSCWQGGPRSLHILGNRDVLSANKHRYTRYIVWYITYTWGIIYTLYSLRTYTLVSPVGWDPRALAGVRGRAMQSPLHLPLLSLFSCSSYTSPWLCFALTLGPQSTRARIWKQLSIIIAHHLGQQCVKGGKEEYQFPQGQLI